jgi:hypothetical protein
MSTLLQYPESILPYQFVKADCDDEDIRKVIEMHRDGATKYRISRELSLNIGRVQTIIKHHT